ncbi:MAG: leucine-rich repeat domain-containing protein [Propionibacteriaceae bacterium]|nr:leucine-rich repeat domain-containing protein [Propionibacteriaceae bacterium]
MRLIRYSLTLLVSTVLILTTVGIQPAAALDVYTTPGQHRLNGRDWRTTCEPYSQTTRCRTEIKATQVTQVNGRFISRTDWFFNNLTYVQSPRSLWENNPLGNTGSWTAHDGRRWSTECDTSTSGANGCRSYIRASVIEAYKRGGRWNYRWTTKNVFNNIVRFTVPAPPTIDPATIHDPALRQCITKAMGISNTTPMTERHLAGVKRLSCGPSNLQTLQGMPALPNLSVLDIYGNPVATLRGLPELPELTDLSLRGNEIADVTNFPPLPKLISLYLYDNQITSLQGLRDLPQLAVLHIQDNQITSLDNFPALPALTDLDISGNRIGSMAGLPELPKLTTADFSWNAITSLGGMPDLPQLRTLRLNRNEIVSLAGIPTLTQLEVLWLSSNPLATVAPLAGFTALRYLYLDTSLVTDLATLDALVANGLTIYDY